MASYQRFEFTYRDSLEKVRCKGGCGAYVYQGDRSIEGQSFCVKCFVTVREMRACGASAFCADCDGSLAKLGFVKRADGRWVCRGCERESRERLRARARLELDGQSGLFDAPEPPAMAGGCESVSVKDLPMFERVEVQASLF